MMMMAIVMMLVMVVIIHDDDDDDDDDNNLVDIFLFHLCPALVRHQGEAEGDLYIDDGHTFAYKNGAFAYMKFSFKQGKLVAKYVSVSLN